jgi:N-acetylneuraminic acid mutarotase
MKRYLQVYNLSILLSLTTAFSCVQPEKVEFSRQKPSGLDEYIRVTNPNGGEELTAGISHDITWVHSGKSKNVKIQLLKGASLDHTIVKDTPAGPKSGGSYSWKIPLDQYYRGDYKIKISDNKYAYLTVKSEDVFSIVSPIKITSPAEYDNVEWGDYTLKWTIDEELDIDIPNIDIELWHEENDEFVHFNPIATNVNNDFSHIWTVPSKHSIRGASKVRIYDSLRHDGSSSDLYGDSKVFNIVPTSNDWYQHNTGTSSKPESRAGHTMAYDNRKILLFGGSDSVNLTSNQFSETWIYNTDTFSWKEYNTTGIEGEDFPEARVFANMARAGNSKIILFGGFLLNDTWEYDMEANTWEKLNPSINGGDLSDRLLPAMSYIEENKILLFGGQELPGGAYLDETWLFDATNRSWTKLNPSNPPSGRALPSMAYLSDGRIIIFGGVNSTDPIDPLLEETWEFNLDNMAWYQKSTGGVVGVDKPVSRKSAAMADIGNGKIILFGGFVHNTSTTATIYDDTWLYTALGWEKITPATSPTGVYAISGSYGGDNRLFIFGGCSAYLSGCTAFGNETWEFFALGN